MNKDLLDFLLDYGEYIVGIPAIIIGVLVSIWIFNRQRKQKSLVYSFLSDYFLVDLDKSHKSDIKISYKGEEVVNVKMLVLKFSNNGNIPIREEDFVEPIKICFHKESKLLSTDIINREPEEIKVSTHNINTEINISTNLLNPGESFQVRVLLSGIDSKFEIKCRIVGISKVLLEKKPFLSIYKWTALIMLMTMIITGVFSTNSTFTTYAVLACFVIIMISFIVDVDLLGIAIKGKTKTTDK